MAVTLKTRKPIVTIRADDLDAFPIWEFCIDEEDVEGMDETWIRPVNARQLENDAYGLTVAAEFATANGLRLNGFVGVDTADGFEVAGFGLPSPNYLWVMTPVSHADKESIATIAGASLEAVFPISFRLGVCLAGERFPREGRID
jgi:hypothetical protein